jgi:hypothetical protein
MSTTITKEIEVEIELKYNEICEAVSDLCKQEKRSLVQDCELDNLDSDEKESIVDSCNLLDDNFIENHISNLSESEVKDLLENAGHEEILNGSSEVSEKDAKILEICKKHLSESQIDTLIEKHEDFAVLIKAMVSILSTK